MKNWRLACVLVAAVTIIAAPALAQQRGQQRQAAPAQQPAAQTQNVSLVRLSYASGWDALPAIVGIERGFFAQQNLLISGVPISNALTVIRSIGVGSSDIAAIPQRVFLTMAGADVEAKLIAVAGWGTELEMVVPAQGGSVNSLADLRGKTIALGVGSDAHPVLIRLLNTARLRPQDVKIVFLEPVDLTSAFEKRMADAVIESKHFTDLLRATNQARTLVGNADIVNTLGLINAKALVARNAMIEQEPQTVQRFVDGWVRAMTYIRQDPQDAARLLTIFFHRQGVVVQPQQAEAWVQTTKYDRFVWGQAEIADAEYNGWGLITGQVLKAVPKLAGFVDNRFAETAVRNLQTARAN